MIPVFLQKLIREPTFDALERTQDARLLHWFLLSLLSLVPVSCLLIYLFEPENVEIILIAVVFIPVLIGMIQWNYRGHTHYVAYVGCFIVWIGMVLTSLPYGNAILNQTLAWLMLVVLAAGVMIGGYGAVTFSILSSGYGFIQLLREDFPLDLFTAWVITSFFYVVITLMLWVSRRNASRILQQAIQHEQEATRLGQQLLAEIQVHKHTSGALLNSEKQNHDLLKMMPTAVSVIDAANATILYVNQAGIDMLKAGHEHSLIGTPALGLVAPASAGYVQEKIAEVIQQGFSYAYKWQLRGFDGSVLIVDSVSILIQYNGHPAILSVYMDLTEREKIEAELDQTRRIAEELEQQRQQVTLREEMLNTASHQFRTPLTIILSSVELLRNYHSRMSDEKRMQHYGIVDTQANYMRSLMEDMLTVSISSAGKLPYKPQSLDLQAFCRQLVEDFAQAHPSHNISFYGDLEGYYLLDPKLLRHIVNNLLSNATKYSEPGTDVEVRLVQQKAFAELSVRDYGIGIPPDEVKHLFEPFFRGSNADEIQGTGLGMSIVKKSVETQGGSISVESTQNSGTRFTVHLPLRMDDFYQVKQVPGA